ncbi:unnamed protein product [Xylocopa violacea]|uniref:Cytochrome b-c1 complex subunit 10 n=1 Tax=Xylocopa violacea TaxID=135666 RepID=A0ABP1P1Z0_XYLVO
MRLGRKHAEIALRWVPSMATYGAVAGLTLIFFTDWKAVAKHIPYYGRKFNE